MYEDRIAGSAMWKGLYMKKFTSSILASSLLLMAGGDVVSAAPASADGWSGFYVGIETGGIWGNGSVTYTNEAGETFRADGLNPDGLMSGLYGGYNWLLADDWLAGVEGEWSDVSAHDLGPVDGQPIMRSKVDHNSDASLGLRLGRVMGDYLPYISGGAAWSRFDIRSCFLENCQSQDLTMSGWTAGAGVEMKLSPQLHARIQYRYADYGDEAAQVNGMPIPIHDSRLDFDSHMLSAGISYHPGGGDFTSTASASTDSWDGFYIGIQTGGVWGSGDVTYSNGTGGTFDADGLEPDGLLSGLYGGYSWLVSGSWLVGVEGEWNYASAYDSGLVTHAPLMRTKLDQNWDDSIRLRLGTVTGDYLPYITGGAAWSQFELRDCYIQNCQSDDLTLNGWTAGAGIEMKLSERLHARIQYRYTDYGEKTIQLDNSSSFKLDSRLDYDSNILSAGISYHF